MSFEATAQVIGLLLRLAELDAQGSWPVSGPGRGRRDSARRRVPLVLRQRYETLADIGRHPAIVTIERGTCTGCHVRLPTMLEHLARRSAAIHTCPHCQRMIYAPEILRQAACAGLTRDAPSTKRARPAAAAAPPRRT